MYLFLLAGCIQTMDLTPALEEVVFDYQIWISDHTEDVQEQLGQRLAKEIPELAEQSWESNYKIRINPTKKEKTVASAIAEYHTVYVALRHPLWDMILDDYELNRADWVSCKPRGIHYGRQVAESARIFCHENAHLIRIRPHSDVYKIGEACKRAAMIHIDNWMDECFPDEGDE